MKATWAYAVVEDTAHAPNAEGPPGCGPPRIVPIAPGVALLASDVPLPAYAAETIESRLSDLDWVSAVALGHERVIEVAGRRSTVVPLKLFTLFSGDERAAEALAGSAERLGSTLRLLAGRDEWGVRVRLSAARPQDEPAPVQAASGTAFLEGRRDRRRALQGRGRAAREAAAQAHEALCALAVEARLREPAAPAAGAVPPVLEAAYLVDRPEATRFQLAAEKLARGLQEAGCTMELTGPWPGYSFTGDAA